LFTVIERVNHLYFGLLWLSQGNWAPRVWTKISRADPGMCKKICWTLWLSPMLLCSSQHGWRYVKLFRYNYIARL